MITVYASDAVDFATNGLGALNPESCTVSETLNGEYEVTLVHPIDEAGKFKRIQTGNILRVPVPAGKTPRMSMGGAASAETQIYKVVTDGRRLYLRAAPSQDAKGIHAYKPGTEVTVLDKSNAKWYEVTTPDGKHGYMWAGNLEYVRTESSGVKAEESVKEAALLRDQPFRIYKIVPSLTGITAYARHIFYDLMDNIIDKYAPGDVTGEAAFKGLGAAALSEHGFAFYSDMADKSSAEDQFEIENLNPAEAILGDGGIIESFGGELMRDWWDVYLAGRIGEESGYQIREGKNLTGISYSVDTTSVTTRIIPTGKDKDDGTLYLPEKYIDSAYIAQYPMVKWAALDVSDAKEKTSGDDKMSKDECYALMRQAAQAEFDAGCDLPDVTLKVDFIDCADTEEYRQYQNLQGIHMGDTVRVIAKRVGVEVAMRMTQYTYNCLTRKYESMTLGAVDETIEGNMINPKSIGNGIIKGSMIKLGAIGTGQLADGAVNGLKIAMAAIEYAHINSAAIGQLNADAITAVTAKIHDLAAGTITTDQLYADLARIAAAQITTANIKNANIDWATIENLSAQIANIAKAEIENADIGFAQIDGLEAKIAEIVLAEISKAVIHSAQIDDLDATVADIATAKITSATIKGAQIEDASITSAKIALGAITAALIEKGAIGTAQIADSSITEAKIVSLNADVITAGTLSVDRLLIKGPNGLFRAINATDEGLTSTELSQEEYQNGMSGTVLVARSVTADKIAAKSITANEILGGTITAAEIDVTNLFAAEAVIAQLDNYILRAATIEAIEGKLDIWANDKISIAVKDKADKSTLDALTGRVSTNETAIKATQDSLTSKVSKTEVDQAIASIVIGGRNLLRWTAYISWKDGVGFGTDDSGADNKGNAEWIDGSVLVTNNNSNWRLEHTKLPVSAGAAMTVSAEYKDVSGECPHQFQMEFVNDADERTGNLVSLGEKTTLPDGWVRSVFTFTVPDGSTKIKPWFRSGEDFAAYTHSYYIRHPKLERGDRATDWTPAPEDDEGDILSLTGRVTTAESNITQNANEISTKVSQSDFNTSLAGKANASDLNALQTRVSSAESSITQNANAISTKVSQSDFNALGQRVSSAESSISQTPNQITAAVSALKVGARNYILGTAAAYPAIGGGSDRRWLYPWKCVNNDVTTTLFGKTVTVSFDYDQWIDSGSFQVIINHTWQGVTAFDSSGNANGKHFEKTFTTNWPSEWSATNSNHPIYIDGTWSGTVVFRNVKMEIGDKATDWTAAPEDGIGGTNLLYCSNDLGAYGSRRGFWTDQSGADNKGTGEWQSDGSVLVTNNNSNFRFGQSNIAVTNGDVLTISAEYKDVSGECPHQFQVSIFDSDGNQFYNYADVGSKTNIGGGWVKSSFTFAIPYGGASMIAWFRSGTDYTAYTHSYYIRRPKLERGSVASDWSQNPEEVRIGSSIVMDEYHTEIKTPYLDIDVTGTNGDTHIDENGLSTGTGTFDHVNCAELVQSVPGQTFTVTTSSGLQEVFDKLGGSVVNGNVTIDIQADQYGAFILRGLHGRWSTITINGNWHSINGYVTLGDCYANAIRFNNVSFVGDGSTYPLQIYNTGFVDVQHCTINGNNAARCVDINNGSRVFMWDVGLYNATNLLRLGHTVDASLVSLLGGNCTNYLRADGARFTMSGTRPDGTYAEENTCLKAPSSPDDLTINYGDATPTVTPATTASFTATLTGTAYPSNHFIKGDNIIRQGYEGTGSSARKDYGCMWFGASALSGKTILSATLTITRVKGKGVSSAVTMTLYTSPLTGKDGDIRTDLASYGEIGSIANGETLTVSIPTGAIAAVAAGGALVLYTGETSNTSSKTYSRHYAQFEGTDGAAPVLTVTYQ